MYSHSTGPSRHPRQTAHAAAAPTGTRDIVLLEESDLYRYRDNGDILQGPPPVIYDDDYQIGAPFEREHPGPPVKFARSERSHRSHQSHRSGLGASGYALHATPFAPGSKRTASIDTIPAHYGALRSGGPVNLFTRDYIGLLLNWVIVGFFNGSIPGLVYPLFETYLGYSDSQVIATFALFDVGWYFKFLFGFITDNYAIKRQRRKPYIFIGWVTFICFMVAMALMDKVEWFGTKGDIRNADAPTQGARYVLPIMISSFAHLMANVACEGMMIEFAHREGEYDRGRTQLWCIMFRFFGEVVGGTFSTLSFNSLEYGGSFAHAVPLAVFFASLAVVAFIGVVVTHFFLKDEQVPSTRQSFASNLRKVWRFVEQRATTQVMVALFLLTLGLQLTVVEYANIFGVWLETDTLSLNLVAIFQTTGSIMAAGVIYLWYLNANWHVLCVAGFVLASLVMVPIELLTVWGVVRNNVLFLGKDWVGGFFESFVWLVRLMVCVEVAEPGLESMSYGLLTTVCNLGSALVSSSYSMTATSWSEDSTNLKSDTTQVRWHLTYEFIFKHVGRLVLVLLALTLLPRQKRQVKEIKVRGAPNLIIPVVLLIVVGCLFVAAITSAMLAMFPSTQCLKFAGGEGCDKDNEETL